MVSIVIGSNSYDAYADMATADSYLLADVQYSALWGGTDEDTKKASLVSATRYLDSKNWQGTKTSDAQPLDWPRDNATGGAVDGVTPQEIIDSSILLAAMTVADPTALSSSSTVNNVKVAKAGSAMVENFKQSSRSITTFPSMVQNMIGKWLAGASSGLAGVVSGNTCVSAFDGDPYNVRTID
jgi:hypothetical protein